jgi:hypothetical protein
MNRRAAPSAKRAHQRNAATRFFQQCIRATGGHWRLPLRHRERRVDLALHRLLYRDVHPVEAFSGTFLAQGHRSPAGVRSLRISLLGQAPLNDGSLARCATGAWARVLLSGAAFREERRSRDKENCYGTVCNAPAPAVRRKEIALTMSTLVGSSRPILRCE